MQANGRRQPLVMLIVTVVTAVLGGCGGLVWFIAHFARGAQDLLAAETRHHAVWLTLDLVAEYVETSPHHEWPRSWDDLERLPERDWSEFAWPRDRARLETLVEIDFDATVQGVIDQAEPLIAIRPAPGGAQFPTTGSSAFLGRLQEAIPRASPTTPDR